ncbi:hypothetical protein PGT21_021027 [Puccinia graminis f. sp. tritici]|uniref:Secreted protein n=1 Tax=Puccinia graminis f. sp. tritici TaxID=56615 RepID=A0A5B0P757_PUCGR|nr:hypothetical protein PGT21_021027 [Puccinia graminis f. sp. tritici]
MLSASFLTLSILALIGQLVMATPQTSGGQPQMCNAYTDANTSRATCNGTPNLICTAGCRGSSAMATGCTKADGSDVNNPNRLNSPHTCNVSFGQDASGSILCVSKAKAYSCTQVASPPQMYCYGCMTTVHYHVPS